jgi:hypothetical protein
MSGNLAKNACIVGEQIDLQRGALGFTDTRCFLCTDVGDIANVPEQEPVGMLT